MTFNDIIDINKKITRNSFEINSNRSRYISIIEETLKLLNKEDNKEKVILLSLKCAALLRMYQIFRDGNNRTGIITFGNLLEQHGYIFDYNAALSEFYNQQLHLPLLYKEDEEVNDISIWNKFIGELSMERMNKDQLIKLIESIKIDKNEFWLLSSSALVIRDIYKDAGDLDIAVTNKGLEQLKQNYNLISKGNGFYIVTDNVECVCDGDIEDLEYKPELVNGYLCQNIYEYLNYLKNSDREKDKLRIPLVENYINGLENKTKIYK